MSDLRSKRNDELARETLNNLEELVRRGNHQLDRARQDVFFFYEELLALKSRATALAAMFEEDEREYYEEE